MDEKLLKEICAPYYEKKDQMHNLSHIDRILSLAKQMCRRYPQASLQTVICGAYLHGIPETGEIQEFLTSMGISEQEIQDIITASRESLIEQTPLSLEGKILHDAHLLEGGKTFLITKSLVTGTQRGQSLEETIAFIEKNILGKGKVSLIENENTYIKKQTYAKNFIYDLKKGLL